MSSVVPFARHHLEPLLSLINVHLAAVIPGLAVSAEVLARSLERDESEPIVDPWVSDRSTLVVPDGYRVAAAAHVLRYADAPEVGPHYRGCGEIAWFVFRPGAESEAADVLAAALHQFSTWNVRREYGWGAGLPAASVWGVPDAWPHVAAALRGAGYAPDPSMHREALYGGWLGGIPAPGSPPVDGLRIARRVGPYATWFEASLDGQRVAIAQVAAGAHGWADGWDLHVEPEYRGRGIGTWLVGHVAAWLRLAGCERIVVPVTADDEQAGAGRFYRRLGLEVFARETHGWVRA